MLPARPAAGRGRAPPALTLRSRKSLRRSLSAATHAIEPGSAFGGSKANASWCSGSSWGRRSTICHTDCVADASLAAQGGEEAGIDDRRLAAARAADDRDDVCRRAPPTFSDQLVDEPLAAEEEARVLLAERQKAAIGREAGKQFFGRGVVDRLALARPRRGAEGFPARRGRCADRPRC